MKHEIYGAMILLRVVFSTIVFYYECCKSRRERVLWETTLNQGESPPSLTLVMYGSVDSGKRYRLLVYLEFYDFSVEGENSIGQKLNRGRCRILWLR